MLSNGIGASLEVLDPLGALDVLVAQLDPSATVVGCDVPVPSQICPNCLSPGDEDHAEVRRLATSLEDSLPNNF